MKKLTSLILVTMFIFSGAVMAQNYTDTTRNTRRPRMEYRWTPERRAEIMAEQLKLTDAEKVQVEALFEKSEKERVAQVEQQRAKRESFRQEGETKRAEMQKLRNKTVSEYNAELEKIIGKEKMDQWKKYQDENRLGRRFSGRRR